MKKFRIDKCIFKMDDEGWLDIGDGYAEVGLAPDEVIALRDFLTRSVPEPKAEGTKEGNTPVTGGAGAGDLEEGCTFNGCGQPAKYDNGGHPRCSRHKTAAPKRDEA